MAEGLEGAEEAEGDGNRRGIVSDNWVGESKNSESLNYDVQVMVAIE